MKFTFKIYSKIFFVLSLMLLIIPPSKTASERIRLKTQLLFPSQLMESVGIIKVFEKRPLLKKRQGVQYMVLRPHPYYCIRL